MRIRVEYKKSKEKEWLFYNVGTPKFCFVTETEEMGANLVERAVATFNHSVEQRGLALDQQIEIVDWVKLDK